MDVWRVSQGSSAVQMFPCHIVLLLSQYYDYTDLFFQNLSTLHTTVQNMDVPAQLVWCKNVFISWLRCAWCSYKVGSYWAPTSQNSLLCNSVIYRSRRRRILQWHFVLQNESGCTQWRGDYGKCAVAVIREYLYGLETRLAQQVSRTKQKSYSL